MSYHEQFDHLGNPISANADADRPGLQHRIIRWASVITIAVSLAIMLWGR